LGDFAGRKLSRKPEIGKHRLADQGLPPGAIAETAF